MVLDSLLIPSPEKKPSEDVVLCKAPCNKNAMAWVQAALQTNLSKFNLFRTQANGEKSHYVVIENSHDETNTETNTSSHSKKKPTNSTTVKRVPSSKRHLQVAKNKDTTENVDQGRENRLKEAASLAEKLLVASREWFLKYLEDSLDSGFGLRSEGGRSEIACLLGQLKKVNHWLDALVGGGDKVDCRVENLRKSLYAFLLEHVNSAIASSK